MERNLSSWGSGSWLCLGQGRQLFGFWVECDSELIMLSNMVYIPGLGGAANQHISAWAGDWPVLTLRRVFRGLGLHGTAKVLPCRDGLGFSQGVFSLPAAASC